MADSSSTRGTDQRKCSVKTCSYTIAIAECRKMCERCRNTQAEQSRKKRQRKREKEDAEGTLIKRRASSKPKPPLYRIPNVGLFTERDWEHLDERLFPKPTAQPEPQHPPLDRPPPVMRSDGYVRSVPPAKDEGAKELVAIRICNIKSCYQPVPVEHKLACMDCHERKTSYSQERKRKRDMEVANVITWNVELPSQPSSFQDYCSVMHFDDASVQNPPHLSASNEEGIPVRNNDISLIPVPTSHPSALNHSLLADVSPVQALIHLPPVSNEESRTETISLTQARPNPSSTEESIPTNPFDIFAADFFSSRTHDAPHQQVSFERDHIPTTAADHAITISPACNDDDTDMEAVEEAEEEEKTESELENEWRLDSLLLKACGDGDEAEVKRLLDEGANVNALQEVCQDDMYIGNALEIASFFGFESIVQLLLDSGADINAEGGDYGNALQAASFCGSESVVKLLLDQGAYINTQGGEHGNALQAASGNDWDNEEDIATLVRLLLDRGAEVNAQGGWYGNALQAASYLGRESVVRLLLDHGADVNAQGGSYGNALQAASYCGHELIVKLLLDYGADVNAQGGDFGNALQAASYWGRESIVKLLLDNGADVNAQGGEYGNALQAASYEGDESIVKLLLDNGADINAQGGGYGNALCAARNRYWGTKAVTQLLLSRGAIDR